jgi:hypothetical protein
MNPKPNGDFTEPRFITTHIDTYPESKDAQNQENQKTRQESQRSRRRTC